jgi:hypothetical protein
MRINARFDEEAERQVNYLTQTTGQSVSHVVREAVALYYRQTMDRQGRPLRLLAAIGQGDSGRSDIAGNYKKFVAEAIDAKYPRDPR